MAEDLYLYQKPFTVTDTMLHRQDYVIDYFTDDDRADEHRVYNLLLAFAVNHNLVNHTEGQLRSAPTQNLGSWEWTINLTNFRSLVDQNIYYRVINSLLANDQFPLSQIIDLHVRLGSLFPVKLLNTLVHRVMYSISLIPHDLQEAESMRWKDIHHQAPFMWILILLQVIIKSNTNKIPLEG